MNRNVTLSLTGAQHQHLMRFLLPDDGKEAAVVLLCGRRAGARRHRLLVREIHEIPYKLCSRRTASELVWPTEIVEPLLERAAAENLSFVKVHSHPNGYSAFSDTDNINDMTLLPMVTGWVDRPTLHGSCVMLPDGKMFGRVLWSGGELEPLSCINVVGDDLKFWYTESPSIGELPSFVASHAQLFGAGTTERLRRLTVAVVGCSGTGSPLVEILFRLGVGVIVLVDEDVTEERNINRILNSTMADARACRQKVDVLGDAVNRAELGTEVIRVPTSLWDPAAIRAVAECDIVFGCMDTVDGRFLLNKLATYYLMPYIDIGVRLDAVPNGPQRGRIREVCGTVNYLQPGCSSLMSRGLFTMADVANAGLRRTDPSAFATQRDDGYIAGVEEHQPAVIHVNMHAASLAVNELLARLHPFREEPNSEYASVAFSLSSMEYISERDGDTCEVLSAAVGLGDRTPLLDLTAFAEREVA